MIEASESLSQGADGGTSPAPAELFGGRNMGEDALRLLGIYLAELKPVLATVAAKSGLLGEAARWAGRMGKRA